MRRRRQRGGHRASSGWTPWTPGRTSYLARPEMWSPASAPRSRAVSPPGYTTTKAARGEERHFSKGSCPSPSAESIATGNRAIRPVSGHGAVGKRIIRSIFRRSRHKPLRNFRSGSRGGSTCPPLASCPSDTEPKLTLASKTRPAGKSIWSTTRTWELLVSRA